MNETLTLATLVKALHLEVITGEEYLDREVTRSVVSRPGVEIYADYFDFYEKDRLQIIGSKEFELYKMLCEKDQCERLERLFQENPPAFIFTKHIEVIPDLFIEYSNRYKIPILKSSQSTTVAISTLSTFLLEALADHQSIHGVMMDIKGVGVLITGKSFVGKSESALELLMRGHTLVSDDRVEVAQTEIGSVFGSAPEMTERLMEVRGLGLIDVVDLFGVRAYRKKKKIMMIVELVKWDQSHNYNRLGLEEETEKIFDTDIPKVTIPVQPGRNIASLIEVAAMNWRLKSFGRDVAKEFVEKLNKAVKGEKS
ncbi:MAG: HPr(Ser) kinase/phosphatase [Bacilli bacterium]|nr:HPr(Ser) kinase/phosphatase [Bacilli bacterium]